MINTILMTILLGSLAVLAAIVDAEHDYHGNGVRAGIAMLCGWMPALDQKTNFSYSELGTGL